MNLFLNVLTHKSDSNKSSMACLIVTHGTISYPWRLRSGRIVNLSYLKHGHEKEKIWKILRIACEKNNTRTWKILQYAHEKWKKNHLRANKKTTLKQTLHVHAHEKKTVVKRVYVTINIWTRNKRKCKTKPHMKKKTKNKSLFISNHFYRSF